MSLYSTLLESLRGKRVTPEGLMHLYDAARQDPQVQAALTVAEKEGHIVNAQVVDGDVIGRKTMMVMAKEAADAVNGMRSQMIGSGARLQNVLNQQFPRTNAELGAQQATPAQVAAQLQGLQGGPLGGLTAQTAAMQQTYYQPPPVAIDLNAEKEKARWEGLQDGIAMAKNVAARQAAWDSFAAAALSRGSTPEGAARIADEMVKLRAERIGDA